MHGRNQSTLGAANSRPKYTRTVLRTLDSLGYCIALVWNALINYLNLLAATRRGFGWLEGWHLGRGPSPLRARLLCLVACNAYGDKVRQVAEPKAEACPALFSRSLHLSNTPLQTGFASCPSHSPVCLLLSPPPRLLRSISTTTAELPATLVQKSPLVQAEELGQRLK